MANTFLKEGFLLVNDNSAKEYNQSLLEYLFTVLEGDDWHAMSDYQSYLDGGKQMLTELIEVLNEALSK